jgi:hypothetical protein
VGHGGIRVKDGRTRLETSSKLVRAGKQLSALEERRNYELTNDGEK